MKKILLFLAIFAFLAGLFFLKKDNLLQNKPVTAPPSPTSIPSRENEKPQIVSTNPNGLDGAVISSDTQIEITFNRPLENEGEFKFRIEPEIKYKLNLSNERKTVKITPEEPFELGHGYSLYITGDSKFTGYGPWGEEKSFHFQTIKYRGI